jgi:hypothetical protein
LVRRFHTTLPPAGAASPGRVGIFRALQLESAMVGRMARIFSQAARPITKESVSHARKSATSSLL